jgi:coronin-7
MRDREYSLFDPRNFTKSIKTQRVDTNTGTLIPLVDRSRNIVYLAGRGDMTLRWVEIGGTSTLVEGNAPIPVTTLGAALAPPSILNLMKAEINRVIILSKDDIVVPVAMEIPRRQYIDFHAELYPPVADIGAFLILVAIFFLIFAGLITSCSGYASSSSSIRSSLARRI